MRAIYASSAIVLLCFACASTPADSLRKLGCTSGEETVAYLQAIKQATFQEWSAFGSHTEGHVKIGFSVDPLGAVVSRAVLSATNPQVAEECLAAFDSAAPFPPLPAGANCLVGKDLSLHFASEPD